MISVVINNPGEIVSLEVPMPQREKGEVLLKVLYGGLCGSDLGAYRETFAYASYPRVPGHEFSAVIEEIDQSDAAEFNLSKGMTVTANPYFNCGHCFPCRNGHVNCCMFNETMGVQRTGAFSEYISIPAARVYDGAGLDAQTLAIVEPYCISYHAIRKARVTQKDRVLILGCGAIGLLALLAAKSIGCEVCVADIDGAKLSKASNIGAKYVMDLQKEDFSQRVNQITGGDGFNVCVEAAGSPEAMINCIKASAHHGRVIVVGISKKNADLDYSLIQKKELAIYGSRNALEEEFKEAIKLFRHNEETRKEALSLISAVFPFRQAKEAFDSACDPKFSAIKTMLRF